MFSSENLGMFSINFLKKEFKNLIVRITFLLRYLHRFVVVSFQQYNFLQTKFL